MFVLQKLSPWVGLRKINVSYWGWEDKSPFTNTSLQWLPSEPNDSGFCAYLERAQVSGLRANPCTANTDGLICEKPVGESLFHSPVPFIFIEKEPIYISNPFSLTSYIFSFLQWAPTRTPVLVRCPAHCEPPVRTAPARPWNACGVEAPNAVWTPMPMLSPFLTANV